MLAKEKRDATIAVASFVREDFKGVGNDTVRMSAEDLQAYLLPKSLHNGERRHSFSFSFSDYYSSNFIAACAATTTAAFAYSACAVISFVPLACFVFVLH
jgi:hypothetical protein